jgi:hypothetical protein
VARLKNGVLGGFLGVIGNVEGYMSKGEYFVRSRRCKSLVPRSEKQLASQMKMTLVNQFLRTLFSYVQVGFGGSITSERSSGYNMAVSFNMKNAIAGQYPDYYLDYSLVRVSEGPISNEGVHTDVSVGEDHLVFTWTPDYNRGGDHVMLLAYAPQLNEAVYKLCGEARIAGRDVLMMPDETWAGKAIEVFLSFVSEDRKECSNSIYLGRVVIGVAPHLWK